MISEAQVVEREAEGGSNCAVQLGLDRRKAPLNIAKPR